MTNPKIPQLSDPKLIDLALQEVQAQLVSKLPWLDRAFGKCEHHVEKHERKLVKYPSVYAGELDSIKVFPDSHLGNFSFFIIEDGEDLQAIGRRSIDFKAKFGLVFSFDYRTVYPLDWQQRTIENVKAEILEAIKNAGFVRSTIRLNKFWERGANVYREFTDTRIEEQYMMRPYASIRLDGVIKYQEKPKCL